MTKGTGANGSGIADDFAVDPGDIEKFLAEPATRAKKPARIDRSALWYVKLHGAQVKRVKALHDPLAGYLFMLLLWESFEHHGEPFELSTPVRWRLRTRLRKLQRSSLISLTVRQSKPLLVQVPLHL